MTTEQKIAAATNRIKLAEVAGRVNGAKIEILWK